MSPILTGILASQITGHLSTNSYESIATATPAGSSTFTWSSIPTTYKHLQIRCIARTTDAAVDTYYGQIRFNGDTGTNYWGHMLTGNGASATGNFNSSANSKLLWGYTIPTAGDGGTFSGGVIDILDYQDTNKYKTMRALSGYDTNGTQNDTYVKGGIVQLCSGVWNNTVAVTSITIIGGTFSTGTQFALYGIKG